MQICLSAYMVVDALAAVVLRLVYGPPRPVMAAWPGHIYFAALVGAFIWLWRAQSRHDRSLCITCIRRMPDDPAAAVAKHVRAILVIHLRRVLYLRRTVFVAILVVLFVALLLGGLLGGALGGLAVAIGFMFSIVMGWSSEWHRRLQPWCPFCRWGDGGDHESSPTPDPVNKAAH